MYKNVLLFTILIIISICATVAIAWVESAVPRIEFNNSPRMFIMMSVRNTSNTNLQNCSIEYDHCAGWPFDALGRITWLDKDDYCVQAKGINYITIPMVGDTWVPAHILWFGFIANTTIYSVVMYSILKGASKLMHNKRYREGDCPECRYSLQGLRDPGCPECGWNRNILNVIESEAK